MTENTLAEFEAFSDNNSESFSISSTTRKSITARKRIFNEFFEILIPLIVNKWEQKNNKKAETKESYSEVEGENIPAFSKNLFKDVKIYFKNGNVYEGELLEKRFHGQGHLYWADGSEYEGSFENGHITGFGRLTSSHGLQYFGNFLFGHCHGQGVLKGDSFVYTGEFFQSQFHGNGVLQDRISTTTPQPGDLYMRGYFEKNKLRNGERTYSDGIFRGIFDEFGSRKEGEMIFVNNDYYKGEWYEDKFCNYGIYEWNVSSNYLHKCLRTIPTQYKGFWLDGKPHGIGMLEFEEMKIICVWKNGVQNGHGMIVAANGDVFIDEEMFENGQYLKGRKIMVNKEKRKIIFDIFEIFSVNISIKSVQLDKYRYDDDTKSEEISLTEFLGNYFSKNSPLLDNELIEWKRIKTALENLPDCHQTIIFNKSSTSLPQSTHDVPFLTRQDQFNNLIKLLLTDSNELPTTFLPLFLPKYSIDFCRTPLAQFLIEHFPQFSNNSSFLDFEMRSLSQVIAFNFDLIEMLYKKFATFEMDCLRDDIILTRLGIWFFYENIFKNNHNVSIWDLIQEADELFENLSFNIKEPFQPVYHWQFIKHLLYIVKKLSKNSNSVEKIMKEVYPFYGIFAQMFIIFLKEVIDIFETIQYDNAIEMIRKYPEISIEFMEMIEDINPDIRSVFIFLKNLVNNEKYTETFKNKNISNMSLKSANSYCNMKQITNCIHEVFPFIKKDSFIVRTVFTTTPLEVFRIMIKLFETVIEP